MQEVLPRTIDTPEIHSGSRGVVFIGILDALALRCQIQAERVSTQAMGLRKAPQAIAMVNGAAFRRHVHRREEEKIAFAAVVPFKMTMFDIRSQRTDRTLVKNQRHLDP